MKLLGVNSGNMEFLFKALQLKKCFFKGIKNEIVDIVDEVIIFKKFEKKKN